MPAHSKSSIRALAAGCLLLALFAYGGAVDSYFASDDWLMLWHYGRMPVEQPWRFFSPEVVWFYRPLQSFQFGLFHRLFGLHELPYNLALLLLHGATCGAVFLFVRELTARPLFAGAATGLFIAQWAYADVLLWKSNYNTLHWGILTLGACACFLRYLRTGESAWRVASFALCGTAFLAKEMAVNAPLLLAALWLFQRYGQQPERLSHGETPTARAEVRAAVRDLWPAIGMALLYVGLHHLLVRDIAEDRTGYFFVDPVQALRQAGFVFNHLLLSFYADPLLLPAAPALQSALKAVVAGFPVLPLLLSAWAWRVRDRLLGLGIAWILLSFLPALLLRDFHASRYYYLPAVGAALLVARLAERAWQAAASRPRNARFTLRLVLVLGLVYWSGANVARAHEIVREDVRHAGRVRALFSLLADQRGRLPAGALVVLQHTPASYFGGGFGARELVRFALNDAAAEGILEGQRLPEARLARLQAIRTVYTVDLSQPTLRLERVR